MLIPMNNRPIPAVAAVVLAVALSVVPLPTFGQTAATNAPTAAAAPPLPTTAPADTAIAGATERPATYTIVQGDTLWSIAHKYDTSIHALLKLNGLKKHALLHIGQVIKIPPATPAATDSTAK
jgi:LysM repeat protein